MKRIISIVLIAVTLTMLLCGCESTCHYCGKSVNGDPLEAGGRTYCSYDCYLNEMFVG